MGLWDTIKSAIQRIFRRKPKEEPVETSETEFTLQEGKVEKVPETTKQAAKKPERKKVAEPPKITTAAEPETKAATPKKVSELATKIDTKKVNRFELPVGFGEINVRKAMEHALKGKVTDPQAMNQLMTSFESRNAVLRNRFVATVSYYNDKNELIYMNNIMGILPEEYNLLNEINLVGTPDMSADKIHQFIMSKLGSSFHIGEPQKSGQSNEFIANMTTSFSFA